MIQILKDKNAEFGSFDILMDEEVRQGIPLITIPGAGMVTLQVFIVLSNVSQD